MNQGEAERQIELQKLKNENVTLMAQHANRENIIENQKILLTHANAHNLEIASKALDDKRKIIHLEKAIKYSNLAILAFMLLLIWTGYQYSRLLDDDLTKEQTIKNYQAMEAAKNLK